MSLLPQQEVRGECDALLGSLCFPILGWDSRPVHRKGSAGWATRLLTACVASCKGKTNTPWGEDTAPEPPSRVHFQGAEQIHSWLVAPGLSEVESPCDEDMGGSELITVREEKSPEEAGQPPKHFGLPIP